MPLDIGEMSKGEKIALGGGAAATVSVVLPWISIDLGFASASARGLDMNAGLLTLLLGIGILGIIFTQDWTEKYQKITLALGGVIAVLSVLTIIDPLLLESTVGDADASDLLSPSFGLFVALVGGASAAGGAYHSYSMDSTPRRQQSGGLR